MTDEELVAAYEAGHGSFKRYHETYKKYAAAYKPTSFNYRANMAVAEQYSLDAFKLMYRRGLHPNQVFTAVTDNKSPGLMVADKEFPQSQMSPGGVWFRQDRDPVCEATDDYFDPADVVDFGAINAAFWENRSRICDSVNVNYGHGSGYGDGLGTISLYSGANYFPGDNPNPFWIFSGVQGSADGVVAYQFIPVRIWRSIWATLNLKAGDVVVFIANHRQRNSNDLDTPKEFAAAGFRELIRTGNSNHPGSSTLYLYERVLTQADLDAKGAFGEALDAIK